MSAFDEKIDTFKKTQQQIQENVITFSNNMKQNYSLLDQTLSKLKSQKKDAKYLKETAINTGKDVELIKYLKDSEIQIDKLRDKLAPRTGSLFVRLFLGKVSVKQYKEGDRFKQKSEYHKFKRKTDYFLAFVLTQFLVNSRFVELIFQGWLVYYYVTLALRENILKVNGSAIKEWWIIHHYISIIVSFALLTWPYDSPYYSQFSQQFIYFSFVQGLVQVFQTRYQSAKLYTDIAMEHKGVMDVVGEGSTIDNSRSMDRGNSYFLWLLLPCLLFVQSFQLYNAYTLLSFCASLPAGQIEWQLPICGVSFMLLALGNFGTTFHTYLQKIQIINRGAQAKKSS